jgi:hypothetical protein
MVVFGAGASYDSLPDYIPESGLFNEERLPLANQLFENRSSFAKVLDNYAQCKPIIPYLRNNKNEKSIEQRLQFLLTEADEYPERRKQISAIQYYLRDIIKNCEDDWMQRARGITNQLTLLDQIQRRRKVDEQVCFVTFNYDTMLERALSIMGINISHLDEYISDKNYKLIKLHGSVNWVRVTDITSLARKGNRITTHELIAQSDKFKIKPDYYMPDSNFDLNINFAAIPAIAIPIENKNEFECPREHIKALSEITPFVDKILMIGWRATEKPFLELLAKNLTQNVNMWAVSDNGKNAQETIQNLLSYGVKGKYTTSNKGFTNFIINREIDKLLIN